MEQSLTRQDGPLEAQGRAPVVRPLPFPGNAMTSQGFNERMAAELTRGLIDNPKDFAYRHLHGALSTLHQQLNGTRALSLRVVHLAQADAGRYPVYQDLLARTGLPVGGQARPVLEAIDPQWALTRTTAELGDVARCLAGARDPHGPGGARFTEPERQKLERQALELVDAAMAVLAVVRPAEPERRRARG